MFVTFFVLYFLAFTVSSLKVLLNALYPVRASWYNIGLELDISHTELDCFERQYSVQLDLMREMLKHWLKTAVNPHPTWEAVITALRSPLVNEKKVAAQLESKHVMEVSNSSTMMKKCEGIAIMIYL